MIVLVKLCITLCSHAGMSHDHVYAVRNVNFHLPSGNWAFVDAQTVIEVVRNAGRVRTTDLAFSSEHVQDFVLRMGAKTLLKVD